VTNSANTAGMIGVRRRDSDTKRTRVLFTLERMLAEGISITVAAVARQANVSTWLVYAPGIREAVTDARSQQQAQHPAEQTADTDTPGLRTDLALARAEITRLRVERDQQQHQVRLALGARLDDFAKADLVHRVDELTRHNTDLTGTVAQLRSDNQALQARTTELEDDLAAARTSLRRMIRAENRSPED
jgi:chromosome segregation ATPase